MPGAEPLFRAQNGGKRHAHSLGAIKHLRRIAAQIAIATGRRIRLVKIGKQKLAAASEAFGEAKQGIEANMVPLLAVRWRAALIDLRPAQANVVGTVEGERVGRVAVAPCTTDLLIIALNALGQISMDHKTDVRFVDPHSESDRRTDGQAVFDLETTFRIASGIGLHSGVIMQRLVPGFPQSMGHHLTFVARGAIDDPGLPAPRLKEAQKLFARLNLGLERQKQIGVGQNHG